VLIKMSTNNTEIRLLLNLWDLGEGQNLVNKGKVMPTFSGKDKAVKQSAYKDALQALIDGGAIAISDTKQVKYSVSDVGLQRLADGLRSPDFSFEGAALVSSRLANAALRWFQQNSDQSASVESASKISSYDEFKAVALETYDQLNRDYNLSNLVPIYQIRREIGGRVTRLQFNDWMLELQSKDIFQFITGGVADLTPDKEKDSITTELGGLRYYAKLL
jgi:hypothetical protein